MVSCSSIVKIFIKEFDDVTEERKWVYHHTLDIIGFIYYNEATSRLQIINEDKIYAYIMNKATNLPDIESVTYNYMKCSHAVFGRKQKYCCTYKINHRGFEVYSRHYENTFKGTINNEEFTNSIILESKKLNSFLVSRKDKI